MVRESDGYQGHLVSPEMGLRRMVDETLALVVNPVSTAVRRVHQVLIDAARCTRVPVQACSLFGVVTAEPGLLACPYQH